MIYDDCQSCLWLQCSKPWRNFDHFDKKLKSWHPNRHQHRLCICYPQPFLFDLGWISLSLCWIQSLFSLLFPLREAMKVNGQMDCHPSAQGVTLSPGRHGNVKKVTGVGGTTYEISVWAVGHGIHLQQLHQQPPHYKEIVSSVLFVKV